MIVFIKKYWRELAIGVLFLFSIVSFSILFSSNSKLKNSEKSAKVEIKALHKQNADLEKEIKLNQDSIKIFHDLAVFHNNKDTVYLKQIKYLQNKTNAEIKHYNSLSLDSQYRIFLELSDEYIRTGFTVDTSQIH